MIYTDRRQAGRDLAKYLKRYAGREDAIVLALPRGGVPVAYEVADALDLPLDVFVVRKLGVPGHPEYAMGAVASGGSLVVNQDAIRLLRIPQDVVDRVAEREKEEVARRDRIYRGDRPLDVRGRTVILVDDGLATGSTMTAAVQALRRAAAKQIVVAVPVGAASSCETVRGEADDLICPCMPEPFEAVGLWYRDFQQTGDDEVRDLLRRAAARTPETVAAVR